MLSKLQLIEAVDLVREHGSISAAARASGISRKTLSGRYHAALDRLNLDEELLEQNVKLGFQKQKLADLRRIENKSFREHARKYNAVEGYIQELKEVFDKNSLHTKTVKHNTKCKGKVGVLHLSDLHFNELVNLEHNKYDFHIAGQRLRFFVEQAIKYFKADGVATVFVAFTADLMNSDRRLDELLATATNRSRATFCAVDILNQVILDLNKHFNVKVGWVNGNEGRVGKDVGFVDQIASDNYDEVILRTMSYYFKDAKGVEFIEPQDSLEMVVNIAGQNLLLVHGHTMGRDTSKGITKLKAKHAAQGNIIDYIIFGHIHEAYISDTFARSGSPVGDNAYSDKALNLTGRASQNIYIFSEDGNRNGIKIDLQNIPKGYKGYETDETLHSYNIKSVEKGKPHSLIMQIVI